jgi:cytochrome P450
VSHVVVSDPALIRRVLTDPETFRPDNALDAVTPVPVAALRTLVRHGFRLPPTLANNGTPSHPELRAIVAEALHPDRVAAQRGWLTGLVRRRVAGLAATLRAGAPVDLDAGLAADLPLLALARLVELPGAETAVMKEFSRAALELFWAPLEPDRQCALAEVVGRFHAVLQDFAGRAGGVVGRLRDYARRHHLPAGTAAGALFFLLVAGQETSSQFLTRLLHRLAAEPDVLRGLATGTVEVAGVVEEGLRLVPPIVTWRRVAATDTELSGVPVPAGTGVLVDLAGAGAHRCLGAQLARMEAAVVVTEAAPLLRGVEVVRAPRYPENLSFRMPDALVIRRHLRPRSAAP